MCAVAVEEVCEEVCELVVVEAGIGEVGMS